MTEADETFRKVGRREAVNAAGFRVRIERNAMSYRLPDGRNGMIGSERTLARFESRHLPWWRLPWQEWGFTLYPRYSLFPMDSDEKEKHIIVELVKKGLETLGYHVDVLWTGNVPFEGENT